MAWIKTVGEDQAVGRLAEIYQKYRGRNRHGAQHHAGVQPQA